MFGVLLICVNMLVYWNRANQSYRALSFCTEPARAKVLTDFYPSWYATRELLLRHRDPYGVEVNHELQVAYYGHESDLCYSSEVRDQQRFVYPLYFVFLIAPIARLDFHLARSIFGWILAACAIGNVLLWLRFVRLRLHLAGLIILFLLVFTSVPLLQNLSILQPFLLPAFFISGAALAVASEYLFLGGALLALACVKPQICVLPLAWFSLWLCSNWRHRRSLLVGFTATLAVVVLASECLVPGWLLRYPGVLRAYAGYARTTPFLSALLPSPWHWPLTILLLVVVIDFCWRVRREPAKSPSFARRSIINIGSHRLDRPRSLSAL